MAEGAAAVIMGSRGETEAGASLPKGSEGVISGAGANSEEGKADCVAKEPSQEKGVEAASKVKVAAKGASQGKDVVMGTSQDANASIDNINEKVASRSAN